MDELLPFLREERIFYRFDERSFLIMLEQHLTQSGIVYAFRTSQLGEQSAFFLSLVILVRKRTQEPKDRFHIIVVYRLMIFDKIRHLLEDIERTQNGLMVLNE
jgi:hypothetical protein